MWITTPLSEVNKHLYISLQPPVWYITFGWFQHACTCSQKVCHPSAYDVGYQNVKHFSPQPTSSTCHLKATMICSKYNQKSKNLSHFYLFHTWSDRTHNNVWGLSLYQALILVIYFRQGYLWWTHGLMLHHPLKPSGQCCWCSCS